MANYATLKAAIADVIKTNGNEEITGEILQNAIISLIESLGAKYQFAGIATPGSSGTNPGTPDYNVMYIAGVGTYPNFGGTDVEKGHIGVFTYNGTWDYEVVETGAYFDFQEYPLGSAIEFTFYDSENPDGQIIKICKDVSGLYNDPQAAISQWWAAGMKMEMQDVRGFTDTFPSLSTALQSLGLFGVIKEGQVIDAITNANKLIFVTADSTEYVVTTNDLPYKALADLVSVKLESGTASNVSIHVRGEMDMLISHININEIANHPAAYANAATALADVPTLYRRKGMKVVYLDDDTQLWIEMLCIDDVGGANWWTDVTDNWVIEGPIQTDQLSPTGGEQLNIAGTRRGNLDDVLNVNVWNEQATEYESASAARSAVPANKRKLGAIITYLVSTGTDTSGWMIDEFIGSSISDWGVADNWKTIGPVSVSQNTSTDTDGNGTITIGSTNTGKYAGADKLIKLSGWGTSNATEAPNEGDTYYNKDFKELRQRQHNGTYVVLPFYKGAIYNFKNILYVYDTTREELVVTDNYINVNELNLYSSPYISAGTARASIPDGAKKFGLILIYLLSDGWHNEQFVGNSIDEWLFASKWKPLYYTDIETEPTENSLKIIDSNGIYIANGKQNDIYYSITEEGIGYVKNDLTIATAAGKYRYCHIDDVTALKGKTIRFRAGDTSSGFAYFCHIKLSDNTIIHLHNNDNYIVGKYDKFYLITIPNNATDIYITWCADDDYRVIPLLAYDYVDETLKTRVVKKIIFDGDTDIIDAIPIYDLELIGTIPNDATSLNITYIGLDSNNLVSLYIGKNNSTSGPDLLCYWFEALADFSLTGVNWIDIPEYSNRGLRARVLVDCDRLKSTPQIITNNLRIRKEFLALKDDIKLPFSGKTCVTFGDSITWYDGHAYNEGKAQGEIAVGYQSYLKEKGMNIINEGYGGADLPFILNNRVLTFNNFAGCEYMTITSGANDTRHGVPVGVVLDIGSTYDTTTFCGAMQAALDYALSQNPHLKISMMTPIKGWIFAPDGFDPAQQDDAMVDEDYVDAIKAIGKKYSIPVLDWYNLAGFNILTREILMNDYEPNDPDHPNNLYILHPSAEGYKRMGDLLVPFMASL